MWPNQGPSQVPFNPAFPPPPGSTPPFPPNTGLPGGLNPGYPPGINPAMPPTMAYVAVEQIPCPTGPPPYAPPLEPGYTGPWPQSYGIGMPSVPTGGVMFVGDHKMYKKMKKAEKKALKKARKAAKHHKHGKCSSSSSSSSDSD